MDVFVQLHKGSVLGGQAINWGEFQPLVPSIAAVARSTARKQAKSSFSPGMRCSAREYDRCDVVTALIGVNLRAVSACVIDLMPRTKSTVGAPAQAFSLHPIKNPAFRPG